MANSSREVMQLKKLQLQSGRTIPVMGQGTWLMGENPAKRQSELAALRTGLDLGLNLIDTAEMYGEGAAEELVGEAFRGRRNEVFIVSKVYPHNASLEGAVKACKRSLKRLGTDHLDMYLLHWRGDIPLSETIEAFQLLKQSGLILEYGISNLDLHDMAEAFKVKGGDKIVTNQVLYNLVHRGIEYDLLPWCRQHKIPVMAYSPIEHSPSEQRVMLDNPHLIQVASEHAATPAQVAIAWLLHQGVIVIPKAATITHVRENHAAINIQLTDKDLFKLNHAFPSPHKKVPLEMR
jgi:diketogulonate reductase-like aldo/keto reductase